MLCDLLTWLFTYIYIFIGYLIVIYSNPMVSDMAERNLTRIRIRDRNQIAQYREEIDALKEQIGGYKATLLKKETEIELVECANQEVIASNKCLLVQNEALMQQANSNALQVNSLCSTGSLVSFS